MSDSIVVLSSLNGESATKTFRGPELEVESYGKAKWFSADRVAVASIEDLAEVLEALAGERFAFAVRGEPLEGVDLSRCLRRLHPRDGEPATFAARARRWVCVDADGRAVEADARDARAVGLELREMLPAAFRGCACVAQLSASAGIKPGARAHLWFWADDGIEDRALKVALADWDPSLYRAVQPHYTAAPVFLDGAEDPCWGRPRLALLDGKVLRADDVRALAPDRKKAAREAGREVETFKLASRLHQAGHDPETVRSAARTLNSTREEPLDDAELEHAAQGGMRYPRSRRTTDLGNAERLQDAWGGEAIYVRGIGWHAWDDRRFKAHAEHAVALAAQKRIRDIMVEAAECADPERRGKLAQHALQSESAARIRASVSLLADRVAREPDDVDADPWALCCENGVVDLRTGELSPHSPKRLITKLAPVRYDPGAACPRFDAFLEEILPDLDARMFVIKLLGYALTGRIDEHVFAVFWGSGANGKSTLLDTVSTIMGDYARPASSDLLLAKQHEAHKSEVVVLKGVRLAICAETNSGRRLDAGKVKLLTGGDPVTANYMRENPITFQPTWKLVMMTNHKPDLGSIADEGLGRRIRLVPFTAKISESARVKTLKEDMIRDEAAGILALLVQGCLAWQAEGLAQPASIEAATSEYLATADVVGQFWESESEGAEGERIASSDAYQRFVEWFQKYQGRRPITQRAFADETKRSGIGNQKSGGSWFWSGRKWKIGASTQKLRLLKPLDNNRPPGD